MKLRVLTVSDLHQSKHYHALEKAVKLQKPDVVALVGDFLGMDVTGRSDFLSIRQAAITMSTLEAPHIIFVRGNREQEEWQNFVDACPMKRPPPSAVP
jgi:predicted phosphodiesterase